MKMTVELSMYPFQENYRDLIGDFIDQLNQYPDLTITTCATSTMIFAEYSLVMKALTELFQWSFETHGKAVFVAKFIPDYDPDSYQATKG